ncbi:MAG: flagellar hook-associated protein FlgK [Oscillospiraceae bacterium]|nr:flagellar hook-associated protein FlgK [Oscillospiraceae bacterium]
MIRPTFQAFETAKRALNVSQAGLDAVGNNIANVNTPGYTRQRVDQVSLHSTYRNKFQIHGARGQTVGLGADIAGINQVRDPYLDTRYRNEAASNGELAVKSGGLTDLQSVLDEIDTSGLSDMLGGFINEITKFAANADSEELAVVVRNAAQKVTQVLNKNAGELATVMDQQLFDLDVAISDEVNSTLERISFLNQRIREDNMYGNPSNELNDERNTLIDQLANYLPIRVTRTPEQISENISVERVSIQLMSSNGGVVSDFNLVDNDRFNQLGLTQNEDGSVGISLNEGSTGFPIVDDITDKICSGGIKGFIDIINGKGDFAGEGENTFRGVSYYQKSLDVFASTFAKLMNAANSVTADEADGKTYVEEYQNKNLFAPSDGSAEITAANITISGEWREDSFFLTTSKYDPKDPEYELDSDGNIKYDSVTKEPIYKTTANNDNLLVFKALLTDSNKAFTGVNGDGTSFTLFQGSFEEALVSTQSTLGMDKSLNDSLSKASDLVISGYSDSRDAISAVSVDEEAINMLTYQNYYNAAARYMTTLDEALGTIIEKMGIVGR